MSSGFIFVYDCGREEHRKRRNAVVELCCTISFRTRNTSMRSLRRKKTQNAQLHYHFFAFCRHLRNVFVTDGCPRIVTREQWGARPPKAVVDIKEPIFKLFIHHTATPSCTTQEACSKSVRGIQNFHMDTRGCTS